MARAHQCAIPLLLIGCSGSPYPITDAYPVLAVSRTGEDVVQFSSTDVGSSDVARIVQVENRGDLPMGIAGIVLDGSGTPQHFSVAPDLDGTPCAEDQDGTIVLGAGCVLPVAVTFAPLARGTLLAAVEVTTIDDPDENYFADPRDPRAVTVLRGEGLLGHGDLFVLPRRLDFGLVWSGEARTEHVALDNTGDGTLLLGEPVLDAGCEAFSLDLGLFEPSLPPGIGTMLAVDFTPDTTDGVQCTLSIPSDDPIEPIVEVALFGNTGRDPDNQPPTVEILSHAAGDLHEDGMLQLQLQMEDPDQPADSLVCTVSATVQVGGVLGSCTPSDEEGLVDFEIDPAVLEVGTETLLVTVTDRNGRQARASTTVLWQALLPDGDDDGDGFGDGAGDWPRDCDDADRSVYPGGAELPDGIDNDCDGAVDEGTDAADDDGDSVSELDGDCDDNDSGTYPGAPEVSDFVDNDCDGIADEGTAAYDGDGDGYAPIDGDCDDRDPERSPAAIEYCDDGYDNDCDYEIDLRDAGGCEVIETRPVVIGGCQLGQRTLAAGEVTTLTMMVYDPDTPVGALRYDWSTSPPGPVALGTNRVHATVLQVPASLPDGAEEARVTIVGTIEDDSGAQAWCSEALRVLAEPLPTERVR